MAHHTPLISTIVVALSLAFLLGTLAQRLRFSPLVGYLLAGVVVGPYTPGFVADQTIANELAEIGVILLMFGVGLHFSLKDLWAVRTIAVPGALGQMTVATLIGMGLAWLLGWSVGAGLVFGLSLSVASTVVLLRALQERRLLMTERGRIALGWLIVEDVAMVFVLVGIPAVVPLLDGSLERSAAFGFGSSQIVGTILLTMAKVAAFIAMMMIVGRRVIPWTLHYIAHTGSRELFRLGVLAIALGFAFGAAKLFGVSFALGAFFAGMILSESQLSQRAAEETLPLRDAFAVLFFVSVGMLFDPSIIVQDFWPLVATLAIIMITSPLVAFAIVRLFGHSIGTALTISASIAQIGEFSFILAGLGILLEVLDAQARDLILAGALISILANPGYFLLTDWLRRRLERGDVMEAVAATQEKEAEKIEPTKLEDHAVLVGFGRVGRRVGGALLLAGVTLFVIDENDEVVSKLKAEGTEALAANGVTSLQYANLGKARCLLVAVPEYFEAGQIVEQARAISPGLLIFARGHSEAEKAHLESCGADGVVLGEEEIAGAMLRFYWTVTERTPVNA
ncbi:MAG TPA: YbaL family putative K(+) efflux transporter [Hyphomicrobiaceae bacterium]|nr:YbaL family putative K(+) efflux transporter [Hyphomicrobiaceae bacterium]